MKITPVILPPEGSKDSVKPTWLNPIPFDSLTLEDKGELPNDLRFTLYDWDDEQRRTKFLFFDIDDVPREDASKLCAYVIGRLRLASSILNFSYLGLYSGGGVHIYLPLTEEDYLTDLDFVQYKKSYDTLIGTMGKGLPSGHFDDVFTRMKLGRVPGAINSKYGREVEVLSTNQFALLPLPSLLTRDTTRTLSPNLPVAPAPVVDGDSVILKECRACVHFAKHPDKYDNYDLWFGVGAIYKSADAMDKFRELSKEDATDVVAQLDKGESEYRFACSSIKEKYIKGKVSPPCTTCPHFSPYNAPAFINGKRPTHYRKSGHWIWFDKGNEGERKKVLDVQSATFDFLNQRQDRLYRVKETGEIWFHDGGKWVLGGTRRLDKGAWHTYMSELEQTPSGSLLDHGSKMKLRSCLLETTEVDTISDKEFDQTPGIFFKNCVVTYDNETISTIKHSPTHLNRSILDVEYQAGAECPMFDAYLEQISQGDPITVDVYKIMLGLALAAIPTGTHEKFFWITGAPGSGKSTFGQILGHLVGNKNVAIAGDWSAHHGIPDLRGKLVYNFSDLSPNHWRSIKRKSFADHIRKITSGEGFSLKIPNLSALDVNLIALPIATSNQLPPMLGEDPALQRRFVILEQVGTPKSRIPDYARVLVEKERMGIYSRALEGLALYYKGRLDDYDNTPFFDESQEEDDDNSVVKFVQQNITRGDFDTDNIAMEHVRNRYMEEENVAFEMDNRYEKRKLTYQLKRALAFMFDMSTVSGRPNSISHKSNGVTYYRGVKWVHDKENTGEDVPIQGSEVP